MKDSVCMYEKDSCKFHIYRIISRASAKIMKYIFLGFRKITDKTF